MRFTPQQYEKLSELFLDIAKAMYIAGFATRAVANIDIFASAQSLIAALFFTYLSLVAVGRKEERI